MRLFFKVHSKFKQSRLKVKERKLNFFSQKFLIKRFWLEIDVRRRITWGVTNWTGRKVCVCRGLSEQNDWIATKLRSSFTSISKFKNQNQSELISYTNISSSGLSPSRKAQQLAKYLQFHKITIIQKAKWKIYIKICLVCNSNNLQAAFAF